MNHSVVLAVALGWLVLAGLGLGWILHEQGAPRPRHIRQFLVLLPCLLFLTFGGAGLHRLWLERRDQHVTTEDLRILERADALLKDESAWNRKDDRECGDDKVSGKWSLFCALETACTEVLGEYEYRRAAMQEVRFAVEEASPGRQFEHRLMDFNNLPETRFDDVKRVLRTATQRVAARVEQPQP